MSPTVDPQLVELVDSVLSDHSAPDVVRAVERVGELPASLVESFTAAELHRVGIDEASGGAGGTTADAAAILAAAGRRATALPVAEQALLGGWLLTIAGLALPSGLVTTASQSNLVVTPSTDGWLVSGELVRVPWAQSVSTIVALAQGPDTAYVVRLSSDLVTVTAGRNLAGERRDQVSVATTVSGEFVGAVGDDAAARLEARGAVTRAVLMAAATQSILALTLTHARHREQFGRRINTFQAVATHLARIAEEAVVAAAAADLGVRALDSADELGQAQVAKVAAGAAATTAARLAHQVHGAMGVAAECDLQLFSRRVWSWRDEYGGETRWARRLGERVFAAGPTHAWDLVCGTGA